MESAPVVVVGAGPSGLVFGLCLAKFKIPCIILEKESDITDDPRGVYLAGDALRVLWKLGLGDAMPSIGHELDAIYYHPSSFKAPPFLTIPIAHDWMGHTIPGGILQSQPKLERALRDAVQKSPFCTLRPGCEVVDREENDDYMIITYLDLDNNIKKKIKTQWLIGADGKRGVVRKKFLEPKAGIKQEDGIFRYDGTWVAANLHISLPTPETHPDLGLWKLGFTPQQVYDVFWPQGWHFCSPPGKATACGRFGPHEDRLWRHEFAEPEWNDSMNAEELLWDHLTPMITRSEDSSGRQFGSEITYPIDCIEVLRCRPFRFTHKVVNKWFDNHTVLIGDAAHVFPPFGGQGIACGIRDAEGLAWRIAILAGIKEPAPSKTLSNNLLSLWAEERRMGVKLSMKQTMMSGKLCNGTAGWFFSSIAPMLVYLFTSPIFYNLPSPMSRGETLGYQFAKDGFYLRQYAGGKKLAQIYGVAEIAADGSSKSPTRRKMLLSDHIIHSVPTALTLLVCDRITPQENSQLNRLLEGGPLHPLILSKQSVIHFYPKYIHNKESSLIADKAPSISWSPIPSELTMGSVLRPGYNPQTFQNRLGGAISKYVIIRQDSIVFSVAKDLQQLQDCLDNLNAYVSA
ncbi:putative monooxygenase [Talaromyces proteolyticus]|uniref:Monooxygenase n=1 Tax=Talaromyces proteolyticus TaxID=1131652 RepID=A0AAD4KVY4_9EURO|nr:putative monooxygenase [Talaromyces proteolyticus]KAH8700990.1 putative monooxygenase [Talaromyces proteolyticus]